MNKAEGDKDLIETMFAELGLKVKLSDEEDE